MTPEFLEAVKMVGFPIIAFFLLCYFVNTTLKGQTRAFCHLANAIMLLYGEMHLARTGRLPDPSTLALTETPPTKRREQEARK